MTLVSELRTAPLPYSDPESLSIIVRLLGRAADEIERRELEVANLKSLLLRCNNALYSAMELLAPQPPPDEDDDCPAYMQADDDD